MSLALLPVCLANVAIESLLYGIFFILNAVSLVLALQFLPRCQSGASLRPISCLKHVGSVLRRPMFIGSAPLFITVTAHWICTVVRSYEAFISFKNGMEPTNYYLDISQPTYVIKSGLLFASVIISDSMMVYRLWVVWNFNYKIAILPCLNILAFTACGIGTTHLYAVAPPGTAVINYPEAMNWIIAEVVLSVFTNTYSTTLIAWRIWATHRTSHAHGRVSTLGTSNLMAALAMFVESAVLFSVWVLFFASLYGAKSSLESLAEDNIAVMAGIAFSLINVRIGLRRSKTTLAYSTATTAMVTSPHSSRPGAPEDQDLAYPMRPVRMPMTVHVHQVKTSTIDTASDKAVDVVLKDDRMSNRHSVEV